jgi:hypothetical protein
MPGIDKSQKVGVFCIHVDESTSGPSIPSALLSIVTVTFERVLGVSGS